MTNVVVSAHGGRWAWQQPVLTVPNGSSVVFYVRDGGIPPIPDGYAILDNLQEGDEPGGSVAQQVFGGGRTYDYSCWFAPEFPDARRP